MTKSQKAPATGFTAAEREYIRGELNRFFSTYPSVAKGFQLKIWFQISSPSDEIPFAIEGEDRCILAQVLPPHRGNSGTRNCFLS